MKKKTAIKKITGRKKRTLHQTPEVKFEQVDADIKLLQSVPYPFRTAFQHRRIANLVSYRTRLKKRIENGVWDKKGNVRS